MDKIRIVLVDDDPNTEIICQRTFKENLGNFNLEYYNSFESAKNALDTSKILETDVIILDLRLGNGHRGFDLIPLIRNRMPFVTIILNTAYGDEMTAVEAFRNGVDDYVEGHKGNLKALTNAVKKGAKLKQSKEITFVDAHNIANEIVNYGQEKCNQKLSHTREVFAKLSASNQNL